MRCSALIAALLFALPAGAQTPQWVATGTGPGTDVAEAVAMGFTTFFPQSEIVAVAGTFEQTITFGSGADAITVESADAPASRSDAYVAVFDEATGAPRWVRRMGTDVFNDFGGGVAVRPDGGVMVTGYFTGIATFDGGNRADISLTTRNDFDGFVAAYSLDGDLLWVEQIGGPEQDLARGVVAAGLNEVLVAGYFGGTATWGAGAAAQTRTSAGSSDAYVAKYDAGGELLWLLTGGGSEGDDLRDLALDDSAFPEVLYAAGTFRGVAQFDGLAFQSAGQADAYLLKIDVETGSVVAAARVGGSGFDYGRGVALTEDRVQLGGSFSNDILVGQTVLQSAGQSDAFLADFGRESLDPVGGVRIGGPDFDYITDLAVAGGFYGDSFARVPLAGGVSSGAVTTTIEQDGCCLAWNGLGSNDGFALSFDGYSGFENLYASLVLGGANGDRVYGVAGRPDISSPDAMVAGTYIGTADIGGVEVTAEAGTEAFAAYFPGGELVLLAVDAEAAPGNGVAVSAAPNPVAGALRVRVELAAPIGQLRIDVVDALGRRVARLHDGPAAGTLGVDFDASHLAAGLYVVRIDGDVSARHLVTVAR